MAVWEVISEGLSAPGVAPQPASPERIAVAPANLADYAARVRSLASLAAYTSVGAILTGAGPAERLLGEQVTANYFSTLGVSPALGRAFYADENTAGRERVALISHALWQRRFGGTPDVIGKTMRLDGPYEIVGVMPQDFEALSQPTAVEAYSIWLPIVFDTESRTNRKSDLVQAVARLAPGATVAAASQELAAVSEAMAREFPDMGTARGALASSSRLSHPASPSSASTASSRTESRSGRQRSRFG